MSQRTTDSSLPSLGITKAEASFCFGFPSIKIASDFRSAIEDSISGVGTEIDGEEVRINTDIDNFTNLKAKIDRIRAFVIGATRPALQASLVS